MKFHPDPMKAGIVNHQVNITGVAIADICIFGTVNCDSKVEIVPGMIKEFKGKD